MENYPKSITTKLRFSKIAGKKCLICSDKASAYNFSGLSCESCKIFFRRNAKRNDLLCEKRSQCWIDLETRKDCPACRLAKCFAIGMRKELVKTRHRSLHEIQNTNKNIFNNVNNKQMIREERIFYQADSLNSHELEQLSELEMAISAFANERSMRELCHLSGYREVFSLYGRYTKKIIKFCKGLSSFKHLEQMDQLSILKPFHSEIISIRTAFLYDPARDGFYILLNDDEQAAAFVPLASYQTFRAFDLQTYCRNFLTMLNIVMEEDPVLRNLIIAQKLFDIRQNISCPQFIQNQNHFYLRLLRRYLEHKHKDGHLAEEKYSAIMLVLSELNFVRDKNKRIYQELRQSDPAKVDEAILELYDIKPEEELPNL